MTNNKLVIRRLPPSMSEDDFLKQIEPLPEHDYFCFFEANPSLASYSFSRAYINFLNPSDTANFQERFDNYIFLDRDGHEYPAVVEHAFWHKCPKSGPFYKRTTTHDKPSLPPKTASAVIEPTASSQETKSCSQTPVGIEQDADFLEFMERYKNHGKRNQQSPIQTLETNLDELTNKQSNSGSGNSSSKKGGVKVMTPLLGYINQKRMAKKDRTRIKK